ESSRRLVHRDDTRIEGERLDDLDDLLLGDAERADTGRGVDEVDSQFGEQTCGAGCHALVVDEAGLARLPSEKYVLGDAALGQQVELLKHRGDSGTHRLNRVGVVDRLSRENHLARVT